MPPPGPDPARASVAVARLDALRDLVVAAEDDLLACLVVTGEPRPQRVLDDWLDQAVDTLRALGEAASDLSPPLSRYAVAPPQARGSRTGGPEAVLDGSVGTRPTADGTASGAHDPRHPREVP